MIPFASFIIVFSALIGVGRGLRPSGKLAFADAATM